MLYDLRESIQEVTKVVSPIKKMAKKSTKCIKFPLIAEHLYNKHTLILIFKRRHTQLAIIII